jgi:hypothetical protein
MEVSVHPQAIVEEGAQLGKVSGSKHLLWLEKIP